MLCGSQTGQSSVNFTPAAVLAIPYSQPAGGFTSMPTKLARHFKTTLRELCGAHPLHPAHSQVCDRFNIYYPFNRPPNFRRRTGVSIGEQSARPRRRLDSPTTEPIDLKNEDVLTTSEAAQMLGCDAKTVREMGRKNRLKCFMVGSRMRFLKTTIERYMGVIR